MLINAIIIPVNVEDPQDLPHEIVWYMSLS